MPIAPLSRRALIAGAALLAAIGAATPAFAQAAAWPAKPLRIIVGFPAGSSPDLTARALADPLEKALGQPVTPAWSASCASTTAGSSSSRASP